MRFTCASAASKKYIVSVPLARKGGGKLISTILRKGGVKFFFLRGGGLDWKGLVNFWRRNSGFLEIATVNFSSRLLFDLLCTCRPKDFVSPVSFQLYF